MSKTLPQQLWQHNPLGVAITPIPCSSRALEEAGQCHAVGFAPARRLENPYSWGGDICPLIESVFQATGTILRDSPVRQTRSKQGINKAWHYYRNER